MKNMQWLVMAALLLSPVAKAGESLDKFIDDMLERISPSKGPPLSTVAAFGYMTGVILKGILLPAEASVAISEDISRPTTKATKESSEASNKARREALLAAADDAASFFDTREITKPLQIAMDIVAEMTAQIHGIETANAMTPDDLAVAIVVFASPSTTPQI